MKDAKICFIYSILYRRDGYVEQKGCVSYDDKEGLFLHGVTAWNKEGRSQGEY